MPVNIDPSGRRWIDAEVEVPGTPEEVWQAIASGPGISAWFVPTDLDGKVGGTTISHFGPGNTMDGVATITEWDPPHRFAAESRDDMGPDDPTVATEWIVQANAGGTCTVRIVHSWFTSKADWDDQFVGHSYGWISFFRILKLYLTNFAGKKRSGAQILGFSSEPKSEARATFAGVLGLHDEGEGEHWRSSAGAPRLGGTVQYRGPAEYPEALLLLNEPQPGIADLAAFEMGDQVCMLVRLYFYGDEAAAEQAVAAWDGWMSGLFPLPVFEAEPSA